MPFAICPLSVIPVRANPSDKAEMVTQLLFGETVETFPSSPRLIKEHEGWIRVRCTWDNYEGWASVKQLQIIDIQYVNTDKMTHVLDLMHPVMSNEFAMPLLLGASLPNFDGLRLTLGDVPYTFNGRVLFPTNVIPSADLLLKIARRYLFAPYLWGGRTPMGIDCSGLTQMSFKLLGMLLPRDAYEQAEVGELVDFVAQAQAGDLAFFANDTGKIIHVGILMDGERIIHASGQVRIDRIDHQGIFNETTQRYSHTLRLIKRILPTIERKVFAPSEVKEVVEIADNQISMF